MYSAHSLNKNFISVHMNEYVNTNAYKNTVWKGNKDHQNSQEKGQRKALKIADSNKYMRQPV